MIEARGRNAEIVGNIMDLRRANEWQSAEDLQCYELLCASQQARASMWCLLDSNPSWRESRGRFKSSDPYLQSLNTRDAMDLPEAGTNKSDA